MKKLYPVIIFALFLSGCVSSSKLMQRGRYEAAIEKSVKELRKDPTNAEEILILERAYRITNERNWERINFLKLNNDPRHMEEIISLYTQLKDRQSLVRTVLPLHLPDRVINFPYVNYDEEIVSARSGAADYYYNNALRLMEQNDKEAYRQAHQEFIKARNYSSMHRNVDRMILQARNMGISRVLVMVQNHTHLNLGKDYENQLLAIKPANLDSEWVEYHFRDLDESIEYDYYVVANIRVIDVSPDITRDSDRVVSKRVQDGFEYVLDRRGNVAKDSLGNDIKVPKYKDISCAVIETLQRKHCVIEGDVEFISMNPRRLLKKEPAGANSTFEHMSARTIGDLAALDEETRKIVDLKPVPFPTDYEMVFKTTESMREAIAVAIYNNRNLIK
jgi:tetratricopeptide (TPR) repeat protein